jgi:hypothetical protein
MSVSLRELLAAVESFARAELPGASGCVLTLRLAGGRRLRFAVELGQARDRGEDPAAGQPALPPLPGRREPAPGPLTANMEAVLAVLTHEGEALSWDKLIPLVEKKLGRSYRAGTIGTILSALERRGLVVLGRDEQQVLTYRLASHPRVQGVGRCRLCRLFRGDRERDAQRPAQARR